KPLQIKAEKCTGAVEIPSATVFSVGCLIVTTKFYTVVRYTPQHVSVYSVHLCIFLSSVGPVGNGGTPRRCTGSFSICDFMRRSVQAFNETPSFCLPSLCYAH